MYKKFYFLQNNYNEEVERKRGDKNYSRRIDCNRLHILFVAVRRWNKISGFHKDKFLSICARICVYVWYPIHITRLSVPNSCRSAVDVYRTNLGHVLYFAFNETRSFAARLNQIPRNIRKTFGEEKAIGPAAKCKFLLAYFPLFLSLSFLCTVLKLGPNIRRIWNFFIIVFTRSKRNASLHFYLRASILQSLQPDARRIFTSTYGSGKHI